MEEWSSSASQRIEVIAQTISATTCTSTAIPASVARVQRNADQLQYRSPAWTEAQRTASVSIRTCTREAILAHQRASEAAIDWLSYSFNGAAAFQPRKYHTELQCQALLPRFNGAAAFQPRKSENLGGDSHDVNSALKTWRAAVPE